MADNQANMHEMRSVPTLGGVAMMRSIGVGIATENKPLSTDDCYFQVIEIYPLDDGEMKSDTMTISDKGVDYKGEAYEVEVEFSKSIKATWLPDQNNRMTSPDIRRGERAEIFRLADTSTYYWRSYNLDNGVRRKETALFLYSNTEDETTEKLTPENSWMIEISTHQKTLSIKTPKNDGEAFGYDVQLDAKNSTFILQDDGGQSFELESAERRWRIANADGSELLMDKKQIIGTAIDLIHFKTKKFLVDAEDEATINTKVLNENSTKHTTKTTDYLNTSSNYTVQTSTLVTQYSQGLITGPTTLQGNLTVIGAVKTTGTIRNNGVNIGSTHYHIGVHGTTSGPM